MKTMIADGAVTPRRTVARSIGLVVLGTVLILLVPLVAMRFTHEMNWALFDFIAAGVLLTGTGFAFVLSMRTLRTSRARLAAGVVLALALALVWGELAVGLFGTPLAGS